MDEETKQPVEGAWVRATLELKTRTIQGDVYNLLSADKPHTRTDRQGTFSIPSRSFKKPLPPEGFGTEIESFDISAKTLDRIGGVRVDSRDLGKKRIEVKIYMRSIEKIYEEAFQKYLSEGITKEKASQIIEGDYFSSLQSLYRYCFSGRSSVEVPPVEGGCDEWELDFAIAKHEGYLEKFKILAEQGKVKGYFATIEQSSELFERKGDYKKAADTLKLKIDLIEKRGLLKCEDWLAEKKRLERKIKELEQRLEGVRK